MTIQEELKYAQYRNTIGELSYDELLILGRETFSILLTLPVHDIAHSYFSRQVRDLRNYVHLTNLFERLGRTEHQTLVKMLAIINGCEKELSVYMSRCYDSCLPGAMKEAIAQQYPQYTNVTDVIALDDTLMASRQVQF